MVVAVVAVHRITSLVNHTVNCSNLLIAAVREAIHLLVPVQAVMVAVQFTLESQKNSKTTVK